MRAALWIGALTVIASTASAQPPAEELPPDEEAVDEPAIGEPTIDEPAIDEPAVVEPAPPVAAPPPPEPEPAPPPAPPEEEPDGVDSRLLFGGIALGVGAAGIAAGLVVSFIAAAKYSELDCPNDTCPPELFDDASSYNDLRIPAGVTIASASLVAFTGAMFLVYGAIDEEKMVVDVGPGSLSLRGTF